MRLYVIFDKFRRYWRQIRMLTIRDGWKKMDYIKKHNMFAQVGENCPISEKGQRRRQWRRRPNEGRRGRLFT